MHHIKNIVFTGPESSGKTSLAEKVNKKFGLPLVEEYARVYLSQLLRKYEEHDLYHIAQTQLALENSYKGLQICDTDLLTIYIWMMEKYGVCDLSWAELLNTYQDRIYLLCKPDIPWEYDKLRENQIDRDRLFDIYLGELESFGLKFKIIEGDFVEREKIVFEIVESIIGNLGSHN